MIGFVGVEVGANFVDEEGDLVSGFEGGGWGLLGIFIIIWSWIDEVGKDFRMTTEMKHGKYKKKNYFITYKQLKYMNGWQNLVRIFNRRTIL